MSDIQPGAKRPREEDDQEGVARVPRLDPHLAPAVAAHQVCHAHCAWGQCLNHVSAATGQRAAHAASRSNQFCVTPKHFVS